jgi:hypothetical protein
MYTFFTFTPPFSSSFFHPSSSNYLE